MEHKRQLEDEQLKILSECSNKLVLLSLRNEKEEKERRELINKDSVKGKEARDALNASAKEKQALADKKVLTILLLFVGCCLIIFFLQICVRPLFISILTNSRRRLRNP